MAKTKKPVPSKGSRTHVVKRDKGWAVKKEGALRASKVHRTKEDAVRDAQKEKSKGSDIVIHRQDGSIQRWEKGKKKK